MQRYNPSCVKAFNKEEIARLDNLISYVAKRMAEKYEKISKAFKLFDLDRVIFRRKEN